MAYLFIIENSVVKPNVETLLISPFKEIWDRDNSKYKEQALKEFAYIEFMTSQKKSNPFAGYSDEIKPLRILENLGLKNYKADDLVLKAISQIEEFNTNASPSYMLYKDSLEVANTTREFLKSIDLNERTKSGTPVYKPADVFSALEKTDKISQTLHSLREKVEQEMFDTIRLKGDKNISNLEH